MKKSFIVLAAISAFALSACISTAQEDSATNEEAQDTITSPVAWAYISATVEGSTIEGDVDFYATENGLKAVIGVSGVTPAGKRGIHIHENGSCDDAGKAAGGHFNPHTKDHGFLPKDGLEHSHAGDMGNIEINENGEGSSEVDLPGLTLEGENGIIGKAVILHEKEDDFGQPTGNAGGRVGCGIIQAENELIEY